MFGGHGVRNEFGFEATAEVRAEVVELVNQLERICEFGST
ncbi:hypothetical protein CK203_055980 [Vitis vinifera]|uniref:Uncharacterized protein n=1 Tax=Vitis vinifera TaxID=29760 RepID=A0A438GPR2_VITVI|nr:hypothetical protein CK203_055980 [Vitis vinifera]